MRASGHVKFAWALPGWSELPDVKVETVDKYELGDTLKGSSVPCWKLGPLKAVQYVGIVICVYTHFSIHQLILSIRSVESNAGLDSL